MFRNHLCILICTCLTSPALAQVQQFPYQARVVVDEAYVRSGGGEAFYPTQSLKRDASVTVRRHDPGGWYMIDPPAGSFSWIPEKYVRETAVDAGEVNESNVVVFVGSSFGDETHVWQRKLMSGEKVSILERRVVDTLSGPKNMMKIKPPVREYRWIPGSAVVPIGDQQRAQHDRNPYAVPSAIARRPNNVAAVEPSTAPVESPSRFSPSQRLVRLKQIRAEQRELQQIDQKFRSMILSPPTEWDLLSLETEYRDLQDRATYKPVAGQIDLRYPAINRYRQKKAELDELKQLTSETERRDAELLASQFGLPTTAGSMSADSVATTSEARIFGADESFSSLQIPLNNTTTVSGPSDTIPSAETPFSVASGDLSLPADSGSSVPPSSRYVGAGLLSRGTGTNDSEYLLTSPAGKVLAHLQPDGDVDLEQHVGQSVGLHGKRYFDPAVNSDRIEVGGLESIRIRR